ncbi:hypothetical protein PV355_01625 [Streptomyces stelliscabiei]|uniref:hypothetical protein n=1 Tax=Streptomyces stelliscabiei TaxID=146820 RepID=UPI00299FE90E|nr:hypothetical protein [Streptomyces stelliscabiei]MDX2513866.1 hypothetical protein [Streptomyces stelliscabiei]
MQERTDQPQGQPSPPHDPRTCQPCGIYRHPAQAKQGRALQAHLAENPFPRQAAAQ